MADAATSPGANHGVDHGPDPHDDHHHHPTGWRRWVYSTNHKDIGTMYIVLSIIGAVVGEWFTGDMGLGSVIIVAHNNLDMPTLFSAIFTLAFIGITLTMLTSYAEKKVLFWHDSEITA